MYRRYFLICVSMVIYFGLGFGGPGLGLVWQAKAKARNLLNKISACQLKHRSHCHDLSSRSSTI